jgi:hypothetical protein
MANMHHAIVSSLVRKSACLGGVSLAGARLRRCAKVEAGATRGGTCAVAHGVGAGAVVAAAGAADSARMGGISLLKSGGSGVRA